MARKTLSSLVGRLEDDQPAETSQPAPAAAPVRSPPRRPPRPSTRAEEAHQVPAEGVVLPGA